MDMKLLRLILVLKYETNNWRSSQVIITTTENVKGYKVKEVKGACFGVIVRSRGLGGNIAAGLKSLVGGEIKQYTSMLEDARKQAMDRMVLNARNMGADAVVMMRFDSGEIGQSMSEIVAYGTAVVLEKE
jgi:uncharacterized protein YbjQ (UPF0145 family)